MCVCIRSIKHGHVNFVRFISPLFYAWFYPCRVVVGLVCFWLCCVLFSRTLRVLIACFFVFCFFLSCFFLGFCLILLSKKGENENERVQVRKRICVSERVRVRLGEWEEQVRIRESEWESERVNKGKWTNEIDRQKDR